MYNKYNSVNDILNISRMAPKPMDYSKAFSLPQTAWAAYTAGKDYAEGLNNSALADRAKVSADNSMMQTGYANGAALNAKGVLPSDLGMQTTAPATPYAGVYPAAKQRRRVGSQTPATPLDVHETLPLNEPVSPAFSGLNSPFVSNADTPLSLLDAQSPLNNGASQSPYSNNYQGFSSIGGMGGGFLNIAPTGFGDAQNSSFGQIGDASTADEGFLSLSMGTDSLTPDQRQARLLYDTPQNSLFASFA